MNFSFGVGTLSRFLKISAASVAVASVLSACTGGESLLGGTTTKFSPSEFGVDASPHVAFLTAPPKGGGRYQVGQPYQVRGRWYHPEEDPDYIATGTASWYGPNFHGRMTANGEVFDQNAITGAHPTLPLPSYVRVSNLSNGQSVLVRINDRGPFAHGRVIDLSRRAAEMLGFIDAGTAQVSVQYVAAAPLEGDDTQFLMASLNQPTVFEQMTGATDIRLASAPVPATRPSSLAGAISDIFAYSGGAEEAVAVDGMISSSLDAAEAMASDPGALTEWQASIDEASRDVDVELGVFSNPAEAQEIAQQFALLGAVEQLEDANGTRLVMSYLKPGVLTEDVTAFASELGLAAIVRY